MSENNQNVKQNKTAKAKNKGKPKAFTHKKKSTKKI